MNKMCLGVIIGNRDFFPDHLVTEARGEILNLFDQLNIDAVLVGENESFSNYMGWESYSHTG